MAIRFNLNVISVLFNAAVLILLVVFIGTLGRLYDIVDHINVQLEGLGIIKRLDAEMDSRRGKCPSCGVPSEGQHKDNCKYQSSI